MSINNATTVILLSSIDKTHSVDIIKITAGGENMNEKDKKHLKTKRTLKIAGPIVLIAGLAFAITGFADLATSFGSGEMPSLFWCFFIGFPLIAVGTALTAMGFKREIEGYAMRESAPVFNEAGQKIKPGVSAIADAVKNSDKTFCPVCGSENEKDSSFCKKCGASLIKKCPNCGADLDSDSVFCDKCGKKLQNDDRI